MLEGVTIALLTIGALALVTMLIIQYRRFSALLAERDRELGEIRASSANNTQSITRLEEATLRMAEKNIAMLELKEELDKKTAELEEKNDKIIKANTEMSELNKTLQFEQEKSDKLLRNILPDRVISDLNTNGVSMPELFEDVTVFFSDIVNFTGISAKLAPEVIIAELNELFTEFDRIFVRNNCERIKTIGDAYLSVSGMPIATPVHYANILNSALEAMAFLEKRNRNSMQKWSMRMGVHSGRVIGGIVGVEKYIYDVFGDTINTAARMETTSDPMRINVSATTFELARNSFDFEERSPIQVKGKGEMKTYFLISPKTNA